MTLSLTLPRFQQLGRQISSGQYEMGSALTGIGQLPLVTAATISNKGNDPEGANCEFLAIYNDQTQESLQAVFAVMKGNYSLQNGKHLLSRTSVLYSSNGNGNVDFDEGFDKIRFIGVASHEHFDAIREKESDVRILQQGFRTESSDYTNGTTSLARLSDDLVITPKSENSVIQVLSGGDIRVSSTNTTANDVRARLVYSLGQSASDNTFTNLVGLNYFLGGSNIAPQGSTIHHPNVSMMSQIGQGSRLDADGNWRIRVAGEVDFANNSVTSFSRFIQWQELL